MITTTALVLMAALGDAPPTGEVPVRANALANETSPYLLQHQFNPVNWMPWGLEAIERAREEDKPIFLSIGYSTCYWCHVMERESFEDEGVAAIINEHFIPIKVDREERPDVDEIYMTGVQVLTGRGGWPISLFLDPHSLRPFAGGTYFPPEARYNKPAFPDLLLQINDEWLTTRPEIDQRARETGERIRSRLSIERAPQAVEKESVDRAIAQLLSNYDPTHGGFRRTAPKFPIPVQLEFLLETSMDNKQIHDAVTHTLDRMAMGGMYDQVGGGFHRYSTDAKWLVPHFEKMLYDNGQLATVYAMALEETEDPFYAEVVREILEYVLREMTSPQGGFYSAQDAEVNHREGQNYLWSPGEVRTTLIAAGQPLDVDLVFAAYGLDQPANFRDPHHRDEPARHVLHLVDRPGRIAATLDLDVEEFNSRLARANTVLLARRDLRDQPALDDKVLASWNGLMIAGMADGGRVLGDDRYVAAAARAADFVLGEMVNEQGELQRSWRVGVAKTDAFLEDHAFMIRGLLALHEATGDQARLEQAGALAGAARERFWNDTTGGYYDTRPDQEDLFVRARTLRDSVVPSGNSMMVANLADLAERTGDEAYDRDLRALLQYLSPWLGRSPTTTICATGVLDRLDEEMLSSITPAGRTQTADQNMSITTTPDVLELAPGASGRVDIQVKIAPGYHLNAPDPVQEGLYGLEILALGNAVTLQVIYPDPHAWQGPLGDMLVYEGTIEVPVLITRLDAQATTSQMRLVARYQLCNDEVCLQPRAEVLPVRVLMK